MYIILEAKMATKERKWKMDTRCVRLTKHKEKVKTGYKENKEPFWRL